MQPLSAVRPRPRPLTLAAAAPAPFRVLFACRMGDRDTASQRDALRRAYALSRAFGADFFLLRLLPGSPPHDVLLPHLTLLRMMNEQARAHRALDETLALGREFVPDLTAEQVVLWQGHHAHGVARTAIDLRVDLIVMPRQRGLSGRAVSWLAHEARVPVLVAGPATASEAIVAATDMRDAYYPVLRHAAEWSQRLDTPLVCVHNADGSPASTPHKARSAIDLLQVAMRFGRDVESVVARRDDPLEGILAEARSRDADLVVVGTRPRHWFDVFASSNLASRLVDRARRSVLVTPIAEVA